MKDTIFIERTASGMHELTPKSKLLDSRIIVLDEEINQVTAGEVIQQMMVLAAESDRAITLIINSPGGEIQSGMAVIDVMTSLPCTVKTVTLGMSASMAAVIAAAGTKGHRYISQNSRMMIHEPILGNGLGGSCSSVQATAKAILEKKVMINELLVTLTGKTLKKVEAATDHDNWMSAQASMDFGLVDHVAGAEDLFDVLKGEKKCI